MRRIGVYSRAMWLAVSISLLVGCSAADVFSPEAKQELRMKEQTQGMLEEILASGKPEGFEKIVVSDKVTERFPLGTSETVVVGAFKDLKGVSIYDDTPDTLLIRYDRGMAMFDVDPRTILITFTFDGAGSLIAVRAVHIKNQ